MNKSSSSWKSSDGKSVGAKDIGKPVYIGSVGRGVLRYVGSIKGKQGLFCGIELDNPDGKHDGTYQGTTYFRCPMNHGVFAPVYKVEILGNDQEAEQELPQHDRKVETVAENVSAEEPERLTLEPTAVEKYDSSVVPSMDVSMASISSVGSSFFDHSIISSAGLIPGDMMINSHATYTIAASHQFLEDIEFPEEDIIKFDQTYRANGELSGSRSSSLPFGEDDEVTTPLVEYRAFVDGMKDDVDLCLPSSSEVESSNSNDYDLGTTARTHSYASSSGSHVEVTTSITPKSNVGAKGVPSKRSRPAFKSNRTGRSSEPSSEDVKKEERPKRPKKQSVREYQNSPVQARPPKQSHPTRTQLLMEQIKASIEAEKKKPKKEVKSRLAPLLATPTPKAAENTAPGMLSGESHLKTSPSPNAKRRRNEPLKTVNAGANVPPSTPRASKPRQSLLPPKTTTKAIEKTETVKKCDADRSIKRQQKDGCAVTMPSAGSKPRSHRQILTAASLNQPSTSHRSQSRAGGSDAEEIAAFKKKRLKDAVRGFDAMSIALRHTVEEGENRIARLSGQNAKLMLMIEENKNAFAQTQLEHSRRLENAVRAHNDEINQLRHEYREKIEEYKKRMRTELEQQRTAQEATLMQLKQEYQAQCAELNSKLEKAEKAAEQLAREKAALATTLAKDQDEKTAGLLKEINSLNAALEMKLLENKTLRLENAKLQLRVDEIPSKDIEISKLKHRVGELKLVVEQKKNNERQLAAMYKELERLARSRQELSESALMENDMLRYKIEEMETSTTDDERSTTSKSDVPGSAYLSPRAQPKEVTFRTSPRSEHRPVSSIYPSRLSQSVRVTEGKRHASDDTSLTRSVASVYLEQGRNRSPAVDVDTIYTPEGTFVARNRGYIRKLSFSDGGDASDEDISKNVAASESEHRLINA